MTTPSSEPKGLLKQLGQATLIILKILGVLILVALGLVLLPLVVGGLLLVLIFYLIGKFCQFCQQESFDSAVWKDRNATRAERRRWMVRDLQRRQLLMGQSRERVIELLGEPDDRLHGYDLSYFVRKAAWFGRWGLVIQLNEQGSVKSVEVTYSDKG